MNNVEIWLWLLLVMHPCNNKLPRLLEQYQTAEEAARAVRDGKCGFLSDAEKQRAKTVRSREVRQLMEECSANGIRIITLDDEEYPDALRQIVDPPIVLFVRGTLEGLRDEIVITVIGSRRPSEYSLDITGRICGELAKLGTVIVSGLAVGIDSAAHRCAVNCGSRTIGVLACGMLVNYPSENEQLKLDIVKQGGAIISELLPHTRVSPSYFQHRNRILSGLSLGTLIIEASTRSGCLLTAEHTIQQGRDLFCVPPHDITLEQYAGVMNLLRDGAIPVFSYIDIINEYLYNYCHAIDMDKALSGLSTLDRVRSRGSSKGEREEKKSFRKKSTDPPEESAEEKVEKNSAQPDESVYGTLDPNAAKILRHIVEKPLTMDEIMSLTEMSHIDASTALADLEIFGHITRRADGRYSLPE